MLCYAQPGGGYSVEDYANFHIYELEKKGGTVAREEKIRAKRKQIIAREKERVLSLEGEKAYAKMAICCMRAREREILRGNG